jgi:hypothetical protein
MDEASNNEWASSADKTPSYHIKETRNNGLVDPVHDTRAQRSDDPDNSYLAGLNTSSSSSSGHRDAGTLVAGTQKTLSGDGSSAEWLSTSDKSVHHTDKNYPNEHRLATTPIGTEVWNITPNAHFLRDDTQKESSTDLCRQCSRIDFKAIFRLKFKTNEFTAHRLCSFTGLSRSMLTSGCPICRVFASTVSTTK